MTPNSLRAPSAVESYPQNDLRAPRTVRSRFHAITPLRHTYVFHVAVAHAWPDAGVASSGQAEALAPINRIEQPLIAQMVSAPAHTWWTTVQSPALTSTHTAIWSINRHAPPAIDVAPQRGAVRIYDRT